MSRSPLDPAEMALRGRIGAYRLHASRDSREVTANARASFLAKFEREVDPEGVLPEAERRRRAEHARKAHFARLALASARARSRKRESKRDAIAAAGEAAATTEGARDASVVARPRDLIAHTD